MTAEHIDKARLLALLKDGLLAILHAYQQGVDVPPAQRYQWEGLAQLMLSEGIITEADLLALQLSSIKTVFNEDFEGRMRAGCLPALMVKAPVKPTTKR